MRPRLTLILAFAGLVLLPGTASASSQVVQPAGLDVARQVRSDFPPRPSEPRREPRAFPPRPSNRAALARAKRRAAGDPTNGSGGGPLAPASVESNWEGLAWDDNVAANLGTPPDSTGAIGPSHYFEHVNSVVRLYNRNSLAAVNTAQLDVFTGPTGRDVFDPQVVWDQEAQRWFYVAISDDGRAGDSGANFLLFGWSRDANAGGGFGDASWCRYAISTGSELDDYPKLGTSGDHIIIGSNVFNPGFASSRIWALPKPTNGQTSCPTSFGIPFFGSPASPLETADGDLVFTPVPAHSVSSAGGAGYVVAADDPFEQVGTIANELMVWQVGGTLASPTLVEVGEVGVSSFTVPANAPQPNPGKTLDTLDARLTQAIAQPDPAAAGAEAVWTQHTIDGPGAPSVVRWYELLPGQCAAGVCPAAALRQQGTVSDSSAYIFNGAISPTSAGDAAAINYNRGSSSELVSLRVQSRQSADSLGTMGSEQTIQTSSNVMVDFSCSPEPCRWGDYAGASPDPVDATLVWGSSQYNGAAGPAPNKLGWRTRNFAVAPATP
jgi:hypothetical protein